MVVPPLGTIQSQMAIMMTEHEQHKAIIQTFDNALGLCAKKHDILEYHQELRLYLKQTAF